MASIVGRLENAAIMLSMMGHFLNNIRYLLQLTIQKKHNVRITRRAREDLSLARSFLSRAHDGVSMNLLTFRAPDIVHIGDASEHGMGAFASHGRAWRLEIPDYLQGRAHINFLEFLTQVISVWIDIIESTSEDEDCILCMGDSTTAMGWLRRSNFKQAEESDIEWEIKQNVARKLATLVLDAKQVLFKQWFKGELNVVADSLSRDLYFLSPKTHENFLNIVAPSQLPQNFQIKAVPEEIYSFIISTLEQLPVKELRLKPQKASELARGNVGILSSIASASSAHLSSMACPNSSQTSSCQPSPKQSGKQLSHQEIVDIWWKERSVPQSHMWHRPSGQTIGTTPDWTETVRLASSSKNKCEDTRIQTEN